MAEIKDGHALPKEDSEILASTFDKSSKIGYILSLGKRFRIYFSFWRVEQEAKVKFNKYRLLGFPCNEKMKLRCLFNLPKQSSFT